MNDLELITWFDLVLPGEEPRWFRGKLRWRRRHERIRRLECDLGLAKWSLSDRFPWESIGW